MEEYIKDAGYASDDNDIIGLYDKELHESMMKATDIKNATEKGYKQGLEQGTNNRNIEIAENMIKNNISIDVISNCTGLSIEQVEELRN